MCRDLHLPTECGQKISNVTTKTKPYTDQTKAHESHGDLPCKIRHGLRSRVVKVIEVLHLPLIPIRPIIHEISCFSASSLVSGASSICEEPIALVMSKKLMMRSIFWRPSVFGRLSSIAY